MQFLNCSDGSGVVTPHGEDTGRGRHLQDQVPVVGNGHEAVERRPANDGIEREVYLRDVELGVLRTEVLLSPECDRQCDAPQREHRVWARSREWARGSQLGLRDLQLLECCIADDIEAGSTVDQHVVKPHVGYDRGGD